MSFELDLRPSESTYVDAIWRTRSDHAGTFTSIAAHQWGIVLCRHAGQTVLTVRGPETRATPADYPAGAEWVGINFKLGAFMPHLPPGQVIDRNDVQLPEAARGAFWLHGATWELPDFENADSFVARLVREEVLVYEPTVADAINGQPSDLSLRTVQRRFLQATGLTRAAVFQIERARYATSLLREGTSILDTVELAGYADQPHLTRALKRLVGQTPAQIVPEAQPTQMSFLFKTEPTG